MKTLVPAFLLLSLAACSGQQTAAENTADQLDNAAEQSDPAAAEVLENAADQVREQNSTAPAAGAMENAANASTMLIPPDNQPQQPEAQGTMPPPKVPPDR